MSTNKNHAFGLRSIDGAFGLKMLTLHQAAATLGIASQTLREMIRRGRFPQPVLVNQRQMVSVETLRKFSTGEWRPKITIPDIPDEDEAA